MTQAIEQPLMMNTIRCTCSKLGKNEHGLKIHKARMMYRQREHVEQCLVRHRRSLASNHPTECRTSMPFSCQHSALLPRKGILDSPQQTKRLSGDSFMRMSATSYKPHLRVDVNSCLHSMASSSSSAMLQACLATIKRGFLRYHECHPDSTTATGALHT